ncbi:MAG: potassium channel protein [Thermodesulfobacteriota bacterium]
MTRFIVLILQFVGLLVFGTVGFMILTRGTFLDSLYMTVITLATVGYRETVQVDDNAKIFIIVLILVGAGFFLHVFTKITEAIVEGGLRKILGRINMEKRIGRLHDHYILCGYGRIGKVIANDLAASNRPFVVIEKTAAEIEKLKEAGHLYIDGDASEDRILQLARIESAKGLVTVVDTDAANVYIILSARGLNPNLFILARSSAEPNAETKLMRAGANKVISPYFIGASRMAQLLVRPTVCDFIDVTVGVGQLGLRLEEMMVSEDSPLCGVSLMDSGIRQQFELIVVAIKRSDGEMLFNPLPRTEINPGDTLIVLGELHHIKELEKKL